MNSLVGAAGDPVLSWVDAVALLVLILYGASGFRAGVIVSASSLIGFVGGGALALWALPRTLTRWSGWAELPQLTQWVVLLVVLLLVAGLGQVIGLKVGTRLRRGLRSATGQALDAVAGAVVVLVTTTLVLWFLAGAARLSGSTTVAGLIGRSALLTRVDAAMPVEVATVLAGVDGLMTGHGFPQVFKGVGTEPITSVPAPDGTVTDLSPIAAAQQSVLRIEGDAPECSSHLEGSGWVVSEGFVVTNAHVVSGTTRLSVQGVGIRPMAADVVWFDPAKDLAVLHVPGLAAPPLPLGGDLEPGAVAAALGYPLAGPYAVEPARVRERLNARGLDIYGRAEVTREVYSLRTVVRPGNSGGPLVDTAGQVIGVVFARSLDDPETGYALTLDEVSTDLVSGTASTDPVPTGACVARR